MLFGDGSVQSLGLFFRAEVDVDCLGVGIGTVDGIMEVQEGEVGGRDLDGVGGPEFEAWVVVVDVEYEGGAVPEMGTYGG